MVMSLLAPWAASTGETAADTSAQSSPHASAHAVEHAEKLARARAALGAAERSAARWGGRIDRTALRHIPGGGHPSDEGSGRTAPVAPASAPGSESGSASLPSADGTRLEVPAPLAALFPRTGLRAGSSVAITGTATTSLLMSLAVAATGDDGWCAVAGMPDLGLRSALDTGLDPHRLAIVPMLGEQAPQVLSALADGVGVLVLGPDLELAPALWRSLLGRARAADTLVLAAAPPGRADIALTSASLEWQGLGAGSGRIRRRRLEVVSRGRGIAGESSVEVLLPQAMGLIETVGGSRLEHPESAWSAQGTRSAWASGAEERERPALHMMRQAV